MTSSAPTDLFCCAGARAKHVSPPRCFENRVRLPVVQPLRPPGPLTTATSHRLLADTFILSVILILFGIMLASPARAEEESWQRMRLPVGQYWISGGGGGRPPSDHVSLSKIAGRGGGSSYSMPAYCIDAGRDAPHADTPLPALAGNAKIGRYANGKLVDERSLADAQSGTNPWISFTGRTKDMVGDKPVGSMSDIAITVLATGYDYAISVEGLTLSGSNQQELDRTVADWQGNPRLMIASAAFDGLRRALSADPAVADTTRALEDLRQQLEWREFGRRSLGAAIAQATPDLPRWGAVLDSFIRQGIDRRSAPTTLTATDRLNWLLLARGRPLPEPELDALATAMTGIGFKIPHGSESMSRSSTTVMRPMSILYAMSHRPDNLNDELRSKINRRTVLTRLHVRTAIEKRDFGNAVQLAAMDQFVPADRSSGQVEFDVVDALHCVDVPEEQFETSQANLERYLDALHDLAKAMGVYKDGFQETRVVKLTRLDGTFCLQWFDAKGHLTTKKIPRESFNSEFLRAFGPARFVIAASDTNSEDELREILTEPDLETVTAARMRAAAAALTNPEGKRGKSSDAVMTTPRPAGHPTVGLEVGLLELQGNGDAGVLKLPDGSLVLIDTGRDASLVKRLDDYVKRNAKTSERAIRLVITHTHQDHIGGLLAILDAGYRIEEIIIGTSVRDRAPPDMLSAIRTRLLAEKYEETRTPGLAHYVRTGVKPWIDVKNGRRQAGDVETLVLQADPSVDIRLHHVIDAPTPNDAGFAVRVEHGASSWLFMDDLTARSMLALGEALPASQLAAGFMKWPHHLWFPGSGSANERMLAAFLVKVGAHVYAFSNKGHVTHNSDRYRGIKGYLQQTVARGIRTFWTGESRANLVFR